MTKALLRWIIPLAALFVVGPLAGRCTVALRAPDGSSAVTPILADSPVKGLLAGAIAMALAGFIGLIGTWINGVKSGIFCAGLTLAWAAWGTGTMDDVMRRSQSSGVLWRLSVEGLIFGALGVALAAGLFWVHRKKQSTQRDSAPAAYDTSAPSTVGEAQHAKMRQILLTSLAVGLGVALAVAWVVATETLKGQVVAAATLAALFGTAAGRWASRSGGPIDVSSFGATTLVFFVVIGVAAMASPAAATIYHSGESSLLKAALAGTLFPPARILPLDWIAGAFIGIPLGIGMTSTPIEAGLGK